MKEFVEVYHPRYNDRTVLVANWKVVGGRDLPIKILYGSYKGEYTAPGNDVFHAPVTTITSKTGKQIPMRVIPLDCLVRQDEA